MTKITRKQFSKILVWLNTLSMNYGCVKTFLQHKTWTEFGNSQMFTYYSQLFWMD